MLEATENGNSLLAPEDYGKGEPAPLNANYTGVIRVARPAEYRS